MKKCLVLLLLLSKTLLAQPIITNAYFPVIGDSLKISVANTATSQRIRMSAAGANQTWNYNFLRSVNPSRATYTEGYVAPDSTTLSVFPAADLVRISTETGQKEAYNKTTTRFELLGYEGVSLGFVNLPLRPTFNQPVLERRASLIYNTTNNNASSFSISFASSLIPDTILAALPIRPDSFRVRFQTIRSDKTDAWGKLLIPGGSYDVMRERRFEQTETKIEAQIANILWLDITTLVLNGNRPPKDTTLTYYFWSHAVKEPIAMVQFRNETDTVPSRVEFKYLPINTGVTENLNPSVSAQIFPNPMNGEAFLFINNSESKIYDLTISNSFGQMIYQQKQKLESGMTLRLPLVGLTSGVYFLSLHTEGGQNVFVKRFVRL
jgi:hypothetical protein